MKLEMFPLLTISFIVYAVLTLVTGERGGLAWHEWEVLTLPLYSGDNWTIRWGAVFLVGSMALLFVELVRATKTGSASITNHLLSFILFVFVLLAFILVPGFGNSIFFIFLTMTFLDPMAGFIVTTVTARRDLSVGDKTGLIG
ncbi:MAG: hypothetical protein VX640_02730 [Pseudomonadota bacterium]|nr:hypothetical protein [Pseudomonadota bacterium]